MSLILKSLFECVFLRPEHLLVVDGGNGQYIFCLAKTLGACYAVMARRIQECDLNASGVRPGGEDMRAADVPEGASQPGRDSIKAYYCTCKNGARTVGCCVHILTVIWYLGYAKHQEKRPKPPSEQIENIFVMFDSSDEESVSD